MIAEPDLIGRGLRFWFETDNIIDFLIKTPVGKKILKSLDSHDKDSVHMFPGEDKYYLMIKASDDGDSGIVLVEADNLLDFVQFITETPPDIFDIQEKIELIHAIRNIQEDQLTEDIEWRRTENGDLKKN